MTKCKYTTFLLFLCTLLSPGFLLAQDNKSAKSLYYSPQGLQNLVADLVQLPEVQLSGYKTTDFNFVLAAKGEIRNIPLVGRSTIAIVRCREGDEAKYLGQICFAVIVHKSNPVTCMWMNQLKAFARWSDEKLKPRWTDFGGKQKMDRLVACPTAMHRAALDQILLTDTDGAKVERYGFDKSVKIDTSEKVIAAVARNPRAIGLIPAPINKIPNVKVVGVSVGIHSRTIELEQGNRIQIGYPLSRHIALITPQTGKIYYQDKNGNRKHRIVYKPGQEGFPVLKRALLGKKAATIFEKHGVISFWSHEMAAAKQRLKDFKLQKGPSLPVSGDNCYETLLATLATEYARAQEVVIPKYKSKTALSASISTFVSDQPGLLITDQKLSAETSGHKEKWNEIKPEEYIIGNRVVGIIVNSANKLESISIEQLQKIYSGRARDWSEIGKNVLAAKLGKLPITALHLFSNLQGAKLFDKAVMNKKPTQLVRRLKNTSTMLEEVRKEPNAIGLVVISELPNELKNLRLLPISTKADKKPVRPSIDTIITGKYPLSQTVYIYVNLNVNETAKRFVQFISTSGKSVENPYIDTGYSAVNVLMVNGIMPVAKGTFQNLPMYLQSE